MKKFLVLVSLFFIFNSAFADKFDPTHLFKDVKDGGTSKKVSVSFVGGKNKVCFEPGTTIIEGNCVFVGPVEGVKTTELPFGSIKKTKLTSYYHQDIGTAVSHDVWDMLGESAKPLKIGVVTVSFVGKNAKGDRVYREKFIENINNYTLTFETTIFSSGRIVSIKDLGGYFSLKSL